MKDTFALVIIGFIVYYYFTKTIYLEREITRFIDLIGEQQVKIDQIKEEQAEQAEAMSQPPSPPPPQLHQHPPHQPPPPLSLHHMSIGHSLDGARERLMDPLVPPVKRGDSSPIQSFMPFNIPTRGEYGPFEQVGYLVSTEDKRKVSILMGRRIHSRQHEYYTFHPDNDKIKIPINIAGGRELREDEKIQVDGLGEAQVNIYDSGTPKYIPY